MSHDLSWSRVRRGAGGWLAVWLVFLPEIARATESGPSFEMSAGVQRLVKVGRWAPITVRTADDSIESIHVEAVDPAGKTVRFPLTKEGPTTGRFIYRGLFQVGKLEAVVSLRIARDGDRVERRKIGGGKSDDADSPIGPPLRQSVMVVVTLGEPAGFAQLEEEPDDDEPGAPKPKNVRREARFRTLKLKSAGAFPDDVHGLHAVNAVVVSGRYELNAKQDAALERWVRGGGHLVVCRGSDLDRFLPTAKRPAETSLDRLAAWMPITIERAVRVRAQDLSGLTQYSQQKTPIISSGRIPIAQVRNPALGDDASGEVLAGGDDRPNLIVRVTHGLGLITFCAVDFHRPPVSTWKGVEALGRRILRPTIESIAERDSLSGARISGSGINDMLTQLHAMQDDFPQVRRASTWDTMLWVFLYICLIGPVDYLIVHRLLKKPRWTWATFPAMVALVTWWTIGNAADRNGREVKLNQLAIVDIDATGPPASGSEDASQKLMTRTWFTTYTPATRRYRLRMRPRSLRGDNRRVTASQTELCWSGFPEDVYGGMYRTGGLEIGRLSYSVNPREARVDDLPLRIWSAQTLAGSFRTETKRLIRGDLYLSDTKRLIGSFEHHFGGPIVDWMILHDTYIYRPEADVPESVASIAPGRTWSLSQRGIIKTVTEEEVRAMSGTAESSDATASQRFNYFIRMLSMHGRLRGGIYQSLRNVGLAELDLTRLLRLNRAVLIGRVRTPAADLISGDGDEPIEPTQSYTFVRIVLPVKGVRR